MDNKDYDIAATFERIEKELIESMMRNLDRHRAEEDELGINWSQWQVVQLQALEDYKKRNAKKYNTEFRNINSTIENLIKIYRKEGNTKQEQEILQAIRDGYYRKKQSGTIVSEFIKINDRKIDSLIKATQNDFERAEVAMLRRANDQYRKIIYSAQIYAASGGTYEKAVDMATKDFLQAGINCVEYENGSRHTMKDYADMAIRTAQKRAYLTGEGEKRKEWGEPLVIMNKRGNPCPKCFPWVGLILIDDVWSGGTTDDGPYKLMSTAISEGLYHPRCKDSHSTYFPGITTVDEKTIEDSKRLKGDYEKEQKRNYYKRQQEKCERIAEYSLDKDNKRMYQARADAWEEKIEEVELECSREDAQMKNRIEDLEKQFSDLTEGYSYDDFIKDFESIEEGFEGSSDEEIKKAKRIAEELESLRSKVLQPFKNTTRTRKESIEILKSMGIDFNDTSSGTISDEVLSKYADFISDFQIAHPRYFNNNKLKLKSISIQDEVIVGKGKATGVYRTGTKGIEIKKSAHKTKQDSMYSKSDDYELHALAHEYGHYIADTLEKNLELSEADIVQKAINRYFDGDIFMKPKDLKDCLSSYGSVSYTEAFAEAFAEAYTCEEPREFARIFKEELENVLTAKSNSKETLEKVGKSGTMYVDNKIASYIENPKTLGKTTHKEKYDDFVENGADVKPLNKGSLKGISYEDGGGYKVNGTQDGQYLQYHPANNSHHDGEYYKLSSGKTGTKRYGMNGELIE